MATSYEDIYRRIAEGRRAIDAAAVEEELTLLAAFGGRVPVMIAVAIAEAQSFHRGEKEWLVNARERWKFPGDKTIFHYAAVGRMLLQLRDYEDRGDRTESEARTLAAAARKCYLKLVTLEFGKLLKLTVVAHDRKRGIVEVMNFMRLYYDPGMTNAEFAAKINELYGYGRDRETGQLSFNFDMLDDVSPETVADLMESPAFGAAEALQVVANGALWCRSAAEVVAAHSADFADAALPEFERLSGELAAAKAQLDELIDEYRRRLLK